jgi:hypothetical protein
VEVAAAHTDSAPRFAVRIAPGAGPPSGAGADAAAAPALGAGGRMCVHTWLCACVRACVCVCIRL